MVNVPSRREGARLMRGQLRADGDRSVVSSYDTPGRITRRRLLASGGIAGAAAMATLNPQLAAAAGAFVADPAYLRRASYVPLVGQEFTVGVWGSSATVTLQSVRDLAAPDLHGKDDAFSLLFTGSGTSIADQHGPVKLTNRSLGTFELFLSPVERVDGPQEYEAVVNRSVGANRAKAPKPPKPKPRRHKKRKRRKNVVRDQHHHARRAKARKR